MAKASIPKNDRLKLEAINQLAKTPAKDETDLLNALWSRNTIQAAKIIAHEFKSRFIAELWPVARIIGILMPKGKSVTWSDLDLNIANLCRDFSAFDGMLEYKKKHSSTASVPIYAQIRDQFVAYFDKVRCLISVLPQKKDYKLSDSQAEYTYSPNKIYDIKSCSLCWRSVMPENKIIKKKIYCHEHDIPATDKKIRRRKRIGKYFEYHLAEIKTSVPKPKEIKRNNSVTPNEFYFKQCLDSNGCFPAITQYLKSLGLPLNSSYDVTVALEHPLAERNISMADEVAWEFYFNDRAAHFELYFDRLLQAEAWLRSEKSCKRGGKRR